MPSKEYHLGIQRQRQYRFLAHRSPSHSTPINRADVLSRYNSIVFTFSTPLSVFRITHYKAHSSSTPTPTDRPTPRHLVPAIPVHPPFAHEHGARGTVTQLARQKHITALAEHALYDGRAMPCHDSTTELRKLPCDDNSRVARKAGNGCRFMGSVGI